MTEIHRLDTSPDTHENFPKKTVKIRIGITAAHFLSGVLLLIFGINIWFGLGYLLISFGIYGFILAAVCRNCDYHGRCCDLGLGLLAGKLFKKKGDLDDFVKRAQQTLPPLAVLMIAPPIGGIGYLVSQWSTLVFVLLAANLGLLVAFALTGKYMACPRCRMRGCCPLSLSPRRNIWAEERDRLGKE